ncbi:MAG: cold shock domain-containing protein [Merismopedia sp. SIO2A8]|nr:cold shock domain-containing protein [Symploca sp. SIO2B6]NET51386.1 cold shock domain-containing protein [Merismopedia sp. SIO2A8]
MKPIIHKGKLTKWNDSRGFGFIQAVDDNRNIFLHISALQGSSPGVLTRRPRVGDVILYQRVVQSDGKVRAEQASIQGLTTQHRRNSPSNNMRSQKRPRSSRRSNFPQNHRSSTQKRRFSNVLLNLGALGIVVFLGDLFGSGRSPSLIQTLTQPDCNVKGNISISSDRKLYHLPGMKDYENTIISPHKGERWFCSEAEARQHGWIKAPN